MLERGFSTDNWGYAPYNRQSFQQVQTLFPTARLQRNAELIDHRQQELKDLSALSFIDSSGEKSTVSSLLKEGYTDAFLVAQNGKIITEHYDNGMHIDQHHLINSVTKTFVGMLAGVAVEENLLDVDETLCHYLPQFNTSAWKNTTIRHLLDMSAGVNYMEDYDDPNTDFWQESAVVGWRPTPLNKQQPYSLSDYALGLQDKIFPCGERFHYKTVLTNVLGMVLEKQLGKPLTQLLQERIWSQLPMRNDGAIVVDKTGFPYVGAGLNTCARDLLSFGQLLIENGEFNDKQIIPQQWIIDTLKGSSLSKKQFLNGDYGEVTPGWHYRNQVWVTDKAGEMLAIGIHGQMIYMNVNTQVVIVNLSTYPLSTDIPRVFNTYLAASAISDALK